MVKKEAKRPKFAPVGKLCPEIHVVILDEENNPQPIGMPGEVIVNWKIFLQMIIGCCKRPTASYKLLTTLIPISQTIVWLWVCL